MTGRKCITVYCTLFLTFLLCACSRSAVPDKTVVVLRETTAPTSVPTPTSPAVSALPTTQANASDWYGWWRMYDCSGDWAHMYGYYWDCCAEIWNDVDSLRLQLWDEDLSKYIGLASARLRVEDGTLRCVVGGFMDRELGPDDWSITRTQDDCGALLHITGKYDAIGKGGFTYEIFLRPWGSHWPGSEDEKPYYYESWYLPLIDAGVKMPDEIGKGT